MTKKYISNCRAGDIKETMNNLENIISITHLPPGSDIIPASLVNDTSDTILRTSS